MTTLLWIVAGGVLMSAIALVGSVTLLLSETSLKKLLLLLVDPPRDPADGVFPHRDEVAVERGRRRRFFHVDVAK